MKLSTSLGSFIAASLLLSACGSDHKKKKDAPPVQEQPYPSSDEYLTLKGLPHDHFNDYDQAESCKGLTDFIKGFTRQYAADAVITDLSCAVDANIESVEHVATYYIQKGSAGFAVKIRLEEQANGTKQAMVDRSIFELTQISRDYAKLNASLKNFIFNPGSRTLFGLNYEDFLEQAKPALEKQGLTYSVQPEKKEFPVSFRFDDQKLIKTEGTVTFTQVPKEVLESGVGYRYTGLLGCREESCLKDGSFNYRFLRNTLVIWRKNEGRTLLMVKVLKDRKDIGLE